MTLTIGPSAAEANCKAQNVIDYMRNTPIPSTTDYGNRLIRPLIPSPSSLDLLNNLVDGALTGSRLEPELEGSRFALFVLPSVV